MHAYIHTYIHTYVRMYVCMYVCVCGHNNSEKNHHHVDVDVVVLCTVVVQDSKPALNANRIPSA